MSVVNGTAPLAGSEETVASGASGGGGVLSGCKWCIRKTWKLVTSTLGMVIVLLLFSFVGAAIFKVIEGQHEKAHKQAVQQASIDVIENLWNTSLAVKRNEAAFKLVLKQELQKYEDLLRAAIAEGISSDVDERVWDFWGSFFYCTTIYTTIGYGHIYPVTTEGKVITMIYSLIGIPLCLVVLVDLGKTLTKGLKFIWKFIRRLYYTGKCLKTKLVQTAVDAAAVPVAEPEEPDKQSTRSLTPVEVVPPMEPYEVDDEFNLPIWVALLVTILYIFLGAAMYCQWESWTYLDAFYFIFISISTIGFGDVLPDHPKYFLLSSFYILLGLALVAMVITVIQDDMAARIDRAKQRIGEVSKTIGLSVDEDDTSVTQVSAPEPGFLAPASSNQNIPGSRHSSKRSSPALSRRNSDLIR